MHLKCAVQRTVQLIDRTVVVSIAQGTALGRRSG
jgi:hypothetical protein